MVNHSQQGRSLISPSVSLREIAMAAGVSAMTVSYALRGHRKISASTRRRVLAIAARLGYQRDPRMCELMLHMRRRKKPVFRETLGVITDFHGHADHRYGHAILRGVETRALELGYGVDLLPLSYGTADQRTMRRLVRARGIRGILLLPLAEVRNLSKLFDWSGLALVAVSHTMAAPACNRVVPHHYANILLALEQLRLSGCRRIGFHATTDLDQRLLYSSSLICRHNTMIPSTDAVPLLIQPTLDRDGFEEWLKQWKPDVVVSCHAEEVMPWLRLRPKRADFIGLVSIGDNHPEITCIDQQPELIGRYATEQLSALLLNGAIGLPTEPHVTMVPGIWIARGSTRES